MKTAEPELTDRQRAVLRLTQEGSNPTEIAREIGITSQGVHGHLRKLRQMKLLPERQGAARRPTRPADGGDVVSAENALAAVRRAVEEQAEAILARQQAIDLEIAALEHERVELEKALAELEHYREGK